MMRKSDCECAQCGEVFFGLSLFDAHQDVDYSRPHADMVRCRSPRDMGLIQEAGGTWTTPEGLKAREASRTRFAAMRSAGRAA